MSDPPRATCARRFGQIVRAGGVTQTKKTPPRGNIKLGTKAINERMNKTGKKNASCAAARIFAAMSDPPRATCSGGTGYEPRAS